MTALPPHGRLLDTPLELLLQQAFRERFAGLMTFTNDVGAHRVYFRDGFPVQVQLPGSAEQLGRVLFEMKFLDEATYQQSLLEPPPKGQRYGDVLLQKNIISTENLRLGLKAQVRRKLHRLFFLQDATFVVDNSAHEQGRLGTTALQIRPGRAIYQGVRSSFSPERLARALSPLVGKAAWCKIETDELQKYGLAREDGELALLMRKGYWRLSDLENATQARGHFVQSLVYTLFVTDALDLQLEGSVICLDKLSAARLGPDARPRVPTPTRLRPPGIAPDAPIGTTSRTASQKMSAAAAETPERPKPADPVASAAQSLSVETPTGPHAANPAVEEIRKQLLAKAKLVENENLFEVLSLATSAGKDDVKKAYFDAARRYHPDRLVSLGLDAIRTDVEKIFRRVSEAYGTLYDDERRKQYLMTLSQPVQNDVLAHAKAMKILEAERAFSRGEALLKRHDYLGAIRELEQAVSHHTEEGEYLAHLAWARVCATQLSAADARAILLEAVALSPRSASAHYFLGLCQKALGKLDAAYKCFSDAAELDPRNIDAQREMRLINMRKDKERESGKGGLFDRLRKR